MSLQHHEPAITGYYGKHGNRIVGQGPWRARKVFGDDVAATFDELVAPDLSTAAQHVLAARFVEH